MTNIIVRFRAQGVKLATAEFKFCSPTASLRALRIAARADAGLEQQKAPLVTAQYSNG